MGILRLPDLVFALFHTLMRGYILSSDMKKEKKGALVVPVAALMK